MGIATSTHPALCPNLLRKTLDDVREPVEHDLQLHQARTDKTQGRPNGHVWHQNNHLPSRQGWICTCQVFVPRHRRPCVETLWSCSMRWSAANCSCRSTTQTLVSVGHLTTKQ